MQQIAQNVRECKCFGREALFDFECSKFLWPLSLLSLVSECKSRVRFLARRVSNAVIEAEKTFGVTFLTMRLMDGEIDRAFIV